MLSVYTYTVLCRSSKDKYDAMQTVSLYKFLILVPLSETLFLLKYSVISHPFFTYGTVFISISGHVLCT